MRYGIAHGGELDWEVRTPPRYRPLRNHLPASEFEAEFQPAGKFDHVGRLSFVCHPRNQQAHDNPIP